MKTLQAVYHPRWEPKTIGYLKEVGTMYIGFRDEAGNFRSEVSIEFTRSVGSFSRNEYYATFGLMHDGVKTMQALSARGFFLAFESLQASTFYDVLQCLRIAGVGLMSYDRDSLEYHSREMWEIVHGEKVAA